MGFDEINGRLEEADQNLLAQAVLNEDSERSRARKSSAAVESMQRSEAAESPRAVEGAQSAKRSAPATSTRRCV